MKAEKKGGQAFDPIPMFILRGKILNLLFKMIVL